MHCIIERLDQGHLYPPYLEVPARIDRSRPGIEPVGSEKRAIRDGTSTYEPATVSLLKAVFQIQIREFLGLPNTDPSIIKQKK
jgi:hypothetical protein